MDLSPVKLTPAIKDYIWGGRKLIDDFNKKTTLDRAAESWELSTHPDGQSIIKGGDFAGALNQFYATGMDQGFIVAIIITISA